MEDGTAYWFLHQQSDGKSPNLNLNAPYHLGQQNTIPLCTNPFSNVVSSNGILPACGSSEIPRAKPSQSYEPHGWFYCLPRFRQAFTPVLNSASPNKNCGDPVASDSVSACARKRFLVFDQSGDLTTLIFSSGISGAVNNMPSWRPKPFNAFTLNEEELAIKRDASNPSKPLSNNEFDEQDWKNDDRSEMHEDTEELDALLYSDDENDYDSEDEEEASTGHSPVTNPHNSKQVWLEESGEEVASSGGPAKRQKLSSGAYNFPSLVDTASSVKSERCFNYEDDAESSCGKSNNVLGESGSLSADQWSKIEKFRETISILENIIPDGKGKGKGKDSIAVIDNAIHYLRSLKDKAKVLGLDGQ